MSMSDSAEYWWAVKGGNRHRQPMTPELRELIKAKKELKKKYPELSHRNISKAYQKVGSLERLLQLDITQINDLLEKK